MGIETGGQTVCSQKPTDSFAITRYMCQCTCELPSSASATSGCQVSSLSSAALLRLLAWCCSVPVRLWRLMAGGGCSLSAAPCSSALTKKRASFPCTCRPDTASPESHVIGHDISSAFNARHTHVPATVLKELTAWRLERLA